MTVFLLHNSLFASPIHARQSAQTILLLSDHLKDVGLEVWTGQSHPASNSHQLPQVEVVVEFDRAATGAMGSGFTTCSLGKLEAYTSRAVVALTNAFNVDNPMPRNLT